MFTPVYIYVFMERPKWRATLVRQKNKLKLTLHHGMSSHDFYISKSFSKYGQTPLNAET